MRSRFDALLTTLRVIGIVFVLVSSASAEVISIENPNKGFLSNDPTLTFYWQGSNSKGLIFLLLLNQAVHKTTHALLGII
jgi:hypothetical protein